MSHYPGYVWYRRVPIQALLNPNSPVSLISQDFLERSFGTDAIASALGAQGTNTVSDPVIAQTVGGVYVTTVPLVRIEDLDYDVLVLGQDWILATCCSMRRDRYVADWPGSWGSRDCAWFSWGYHPGEPLCAPAEI